jgi:hypothetical protein
MCYRSDGDRQTGSTHQCSYTSITSMATGLCASLFCPRPLQHPFNKPSFCRCQRRHAFYIPSFCRCLWRHTFNTPLFCRCLWRQGFYTPLLDYCHWRQVFWQFFTTIAPNGYLLKNDYRPTGKRLCKPLNIITLQWLCLNISILCSKTGSCLIQPSCDFSATMACQLMVCVTPSTPYYPLPSTQYQSFLPLLLPSKT